MKKLKLTLLLSMTLLATSVASSVASAGIFAGSRPDGLGIQANGLLQVAPVTPNAVNSQAKANSLAAIAPIHVVGESEAFFSRLKTVVASQPGAKLIKSTPDYVYAEFTSPLMGFVDDVEFQLNVKTNVVDVRSASRLGLSDLGANRKRIEALREQLK
jgi:uncharacterized protein (DUF1499 family)